MELPISFFLNYAWNPDALPADGVAAYTQHWAAQQFGTKHATDIADILAKYAKYNARRKPELLDAKTYNLATGEWAGVVAEYNQLLTRAEAINQKLPAADRDAYYELVLHPVQACANLNELYYTVAQNREAAKTNQPTTNALAEKAKVLYAKDTEIKNRYHAVAGGKWNHMMDQTHIGYTYWQQPEVDKMPEVVTLPAGATATAAAPKPAMAEHRLRVARRRALHPSRECRPHHLAAPARPGAHGGGRYGDAGHGCAHGRAGRQQPALRVPHYAAAGWPHDGKRLPRADSGLYQYHRPALRGVY
jgi:hypothetical protein